MTIRRGVDHSVIKGPSEKSRSSSKEEIAQQQNTIEIELNKNKINNTSYDKHSFNNAEETDSNDNDDTSLLAGCDANRNEESDSDNEEIDREGDDTNKHESEKKTDITTKMKLIKTRIIPKTRMIPILKKKIAGSNDV